MKKTVYYLLKIFVALSNCLNQCCSDGIYLLSLVHRVWKLTLKVLVGRIYFCLRLIFLLSWVRLWLNGSLDGQEVSEWIDRRIACCVYVYIMIINATRYVGSDRVYFSLLFFVYLVNGNIEIKTSQLNTWYSLGNQYIIACITW